MPSARSTLALVAALAYGASVMAMPMQNSYDLVERDYDDLAELDARMYDTDIEEYYVRDVTTPAVAAPTPDATTEASPAATSGVPTHHKGPHHHGHKDKHHHKHHSHGQKHGKEGEVAPTTTTDSLSAPAPSPDAANSKLSAREPRGGKGRRGNKGRGKKGRGRKGRKHGKGRRGGKRATAAAEASAEPPAGGDAPAAEPIAARGLFSKKKTADEKASVTSESTPKAEEKEVDAATESSPATPKHKHKHSKKAGRRHGLHRLHRHRLGKASKPTSTSSLETSPTPAATV